jgi:hypothetical protein
LIANPLFGGRPVKRIHTCDEFEAALDRVQFARDRVADLQWLISTREMPLRTYGVWGVFLHLVHDAIAAKDWSSVGELLKLYDSVQLVGKRGEMWEACYVVFLEDVRLPEEPADLRKFWQVCPPTFLQNIQRDRRIQRTR